MIKFQLLIITIFLLIAVGFAQLSFPINKVQRKEDGNRFLQKQFSVINNYNNVYMLSIFIGKSKQQLNVQLDTGSYVLWFASSSCTGCQGSYPNRYDCQASDGCILSSKTDDILFGDGTDISGTVGQIPLFFSDGTKINNQYFLYVTSGKNIVSGQEDGIIGLGTGDRYNAQGSNWVNILYANNVISANQFSLYLDNTGTNLQTSNSRLMLGSLDKYYIQSEAKISTFAVTTTQKWSITAVEIDFGSDTIQNSSIDVLIDSGTSFMALPKSMLDKIKQIMINRYGMQFDNNYGFYGSCGQRLPTFSFKFNDLNNNIVTYTLEPEFYALYDSKQNQCSFIVTEYDSVLLGDVFMMKYVTTFQYSPYLLISFAESITKPNTIPFLSAPSDNSFPLWAKIVIPVAGCILLGAVGFYAYSRYKEKKLAKEQQQKQQQQQTQYFSQQQILQIPVQQVYIPSNQTGQQQQYFSIQQQNQGNYSYRQNQ